jgi:hypothetical protein
MVRFLVEQGADTTVRDDQFDATPLAWAQFLDHTEVIEYLNG